MRLDLATMLAGAVTLGIFLLHVPDGEHGALWLLALLAGVLIKPMIFVITAFLVFKLMISGHAPFGPAAGLCGGLSIILPVVTDAILDGRTPSGAGAQWLMAVSVLAAVLFAAAIRLQQLSLRRPGGGGMSLRRPYTWIPYGAMATIYSLLVGVLATAGLSWRAWVVVGGALVCTALVVARQLAAFRNIAELLRERDELAAKLTELAYHDGLTGLANRANFMENLGRVDGPVTIFLIDLDDFKPVNDRYGHATGDRLLIEVADRLRAAVRDGDTVARLGGDEFAVLIRERVDARLPDLTAALHGTVWIGGAGIELRASIGMAYGEGDTERLLHEADMAMYAAKRLTADAR